MFARLCIYKGSISASICLNSAKGKGDKGAESFDLNNEDIRLTSMKSFWYL